MPADSDPIGRMVYEDISVDVNGIPERIPDLYYQRFPLIKTKPDTYEDWKRRNAGTGKLIEGLCTEIEQLKLDVGKLAWEKRVENRRHLNESDFESNQKIVDILSGRLVGNLSDYRIERACCQSWVKVQGRRFAKSDYIYRFLSSCHH